MSISEDDIQKIVNIVSGQIEQDLPPKVLRNVIYQVLDRLSEKQTSASTATPSGPSSTIIPSEQNRTQGLYDRIERTDTNRIIISAFGKNRPGVVAAISKILADGSVNIQDIQQNIMQEFFGMIMVADMSQASMSFDDIKNCLTEVENNLGCKILTQHEDIFRYMHRI